MMMINEKVSQLSSIFHMPRMMSGAFYMFTSLDIQNKL